MEIEGKKIILTGAANGIGRALFEKLFKNNAVIGVFDIDQKGLVQLNNTYKGVFCRVCDVTNYDEVEKTIDEFYQTYHEIDILINNAGILFNSPLVSFSPAGIKKHGIDAWQRVIDTNLNSLFYMTVNVVEKMMKNRTKGLIVNISSISSAGNAGQSAYSAAKAGVNALTVTWAKELGLMGIRVVGIAPGFISTESTHNVMSESNLNNVIKEVQLRRLGRPDEIADGVIFAIRNDFINGKVLELDGGLFF